MTSRLDRRQLMRSVAGAGVGVGVGGLISLRAGGVVLASGAPSSPGFLLVFLRGGYDCANAIIPYASDFYYEARPTIAIARPAPADATGAPRERAEQPGGALRLDDGWALAPALRPTLGGLFAKGQVAFVPFAGTDDLSRSHFETQDHIERGQPLVGGRDFRSGFLARLSSVVRGAAPIAFTDALPRCFQGASVPNISLRRLAAPPFDERQSAILASMYKGGPLETAVSDGLEVRHLVARELEQELRDANRGSVNPKGFEQEARRIGRLMRDTYRIGFVDVGGWDTHVGEGGAEGALATNLDSLGRGLVALAEALGPRWRDTVVVVVSEFGRTFRENGNKGTDHGHGSTYWILGGGVRGGKVAGPQIEITRATLLHDREYPVLTDVRGLLGGIFARMWGLAADDLDQIFPGAAPVDLGLV
jgi:uncharacterized protein (DUF1501 family)